jgi:Fe-S cluster assembly iron-binding protein IscA
MAVVVVAAWSREEKPMLAVTERAKETLSQIRTSAHVDDPKSGLRLASGTSGKLELFPDRQRPGDQVVEYVGEPVLLVDRELASALTGVRIDCQATQQGPQLVLTRPGAPANGQMEDEETT